MVLYHLSFLFPKFQLKAPFYNALPNFLLLEQTHFELVEIPHFVGSGAIRPVLLAFSAVGLYQVADHHNHRHFLLPDHQPEVPD